MSAVILRGDARRLPLADASVDLVVTSPPYFALRSYTDGGEHYDGQIGAEATPREYIASLVECTREWVRVLKPSGSIWVNLGDKYNSAASGQNGSNTETLRRPRKDRVMERGSTTRAVPTKSLMMLPERYRIACVDEIGLIARAVVVWDKPNGLPESVTDRVRRSHEDWVHLTKLPRYFSAVDEIRTPHLAKPQRRLTAHENRALGNTDRKGGWSGLLRDQPQQDGHPLGALPGSVWEIATEPLKVPDHLGVDHFAAFPTEWPRRIILGWSPSGICTACGEGRRPVSVGETAPTQRVHNGYTRGDAIGQRGGMVPLPMRRTTTITGYACACPDTTAPTRPAVVLDPFSGTGTTALVASVLGRTGIGVDMSADYCRLATWRTTDPGQRAKAMRVDKPPTQLAGQGDLFEIGATA